MRSSADITAKANFKGSVLTALSKTVRLVSRQVRVWGVTSRGVFSLYPWSLLPSSHQAFRQANWALAPRRAGPFP